jgi:formylglycine-generating enzyme required for sulfatase activity
MSQQPKDLIPRIKKILMPILETPDAREALLIDAFYLKDPTLHEFDLSGTTSLFTSKLIKRLFDHGNLADGTPSLAHLLTTARHSLGTEHHQPLEDLISAIQASPLPAEGPASTTVAVRSLPAQSAAASVQSIDIPRENRRPSVFVSYSTYDREIAQQLIADLNRHGHLCWIDTSSIRAGEVWASAIADGIINSYAFVPILSLNSIKSGWMGKEILWAIDKKKLIIPWILEEAVRDHSVYMPVIDKQRIEAFREPPEKCLTRLLSELPAPPASLFEGETAPAVSTEHQQGLRRKKELAYLESLRLRELLGTERYVELAATHQAKVPDRIPKMRTLFELLPIAKNDDSPRQSRPIGSAVEEILTSRRVVLLGEPGGGKTTTLWKVADALVSAALRDREAPIPLLVRMGQWTDPQQPIESFIASQVHDLGDHLTTLLEQDRAALLLDGLNELPVGQRDLKYPQVESLLARYPGGIGLVSCRKQDYQKIELGWDEITITPLDPPRIEEFVGNYLGEDQGGKLFWDLAGPRARNLHQQFIDEFTGKLADPQDVFWLATQLPDGLKWGYENSRWQRWIQERESPSSMMVLARNPYMLLMLTSVFKKHNYLPDNRGELFHLFVLLLLEREVQLRKLEEYTAAEQQQLLDGLAEVAARMQNLRGADRQGDAMTVLPHAQVSAILGDRLLYLATSASILDPGEDVRFTHQLLQEYFVALYMDQERKSGRLRAADIWQQERWWERTNWEVAANLLTGLYNKNCAEVIEWIADGNPEVAAQCILESGASLPEEERPAFAKRLLPRLTDLEREPEPAARAALGRALGLVGFDKRKGVGNRTHQLDSGETISLPNLDWVEIPAGRFKFGDESKYAAKPEDVELPTFYIARYPITMAQFQTFIDDPQGASDPRWFEGLAADEGDRQLEPQYFKYLNHPRETVNWYQAIAFCRWLSWRLGGEYDPKKIARWAVRLPTEYEWEKAARGTDGRIYPYAGDFDPAKANTWETGIGQTTAVGIFPNGQSPYGVMDMSGNVWEWCLNKYEKPHELPARIKLDGTSGRPLRGGSWLAIKASLAPSVVATFLRSVTAALAVFG